MFKTGLTRLKRNWKSLLFIVGALAIFILLDSFGPQFRRVLNESKASLEPNTDSWIHWIESLYGFLRWSSIILIMGIVAVGLVGFFISVIVDICRQARNGK